jgi:hypothetical protein
MQVLVLGICSSGCWAPAYISGGIARPAHIGNNVWRWGWSWGAVGAGIGGRGAVLAAANRQQPQGRHDEQHPVAAD